MMRITQNITYKIEQYTMQNVLEHDGIHSQECPRLPLINLAEEKPIWGTTKRFCSLAATIKSLKIKWRIKSLTVKNAKTQLRYEIALKV